MYHFHAQKHIVHYSHRVTGHMLTWTVVAMVAEQALGVCQFSCGGNLGSPQHQRLLVEHPGMHEDQHEDGGQAVRLRRHTQRMWL